MSDYPQVVLQAKPGVGELVKQCAEKHITFDQLCLKVSAMGYKTTSLYEMLRAYEETNG